MTRASDTAKLLGAGATILDGTTISTADNTTQLTLTSTDADASGGPVLDLYRNSSSPADNDTVGKLLFQGENDAGEKTTYAEVVGLMADVSNGTEDGQVTFQTIKAGALVPRLTFADSETTINDGSVDVDFRVESNGDANMLFVDGGTDTVIVGHNVSRTTMFNSTVGGSLQVEGTTAEGATVSIARNSNDDNGPNLVLAKSNSTSNAGVTVVTEDALLGRISWQGADGSQTVEAARIEGFVDATPGANDMPGRLVFSTTADGAATVSEVMRCTRNAQVQLKSGAAVVGANETLNVNCHQEAGGDKYGIFVSGNTDTGSHTSLRFYNTTHGVIGSVTHSATGTAYNTSSDYRLKESVTYDFDATTRLKKLKPARFNFIADADTTVDGFIAHEVSSIVPEAVNGEKDAMIAEVLYVDGDEIPDDKKVGDVKTASQIKPQGIDQSKLVPLLVKTIQELEARITTLENA